MLFPPLLPLHHLNYFDNQRDSFKKLNNSKQQDASKNVNKQNVNEQIADLRSQIIVLEDRANVLENRVRNRRYKITALSAFLCPMTCPIAVLSLLFFLTYCTRNDVCSCCNPCGACEYGTREEDTLGYLPANSKCELIFSVCCPTNIYTGISESRPDRLRYYYLLPPEKQEMEDISSQQIALRDRVTILMPNQSKQIALEIFQKIEDKNIRDLIGAYLKQDDVVNEPFVHRLIYYPPPDPINHNSSPPQKERINLVPGWAN